MKNNLVNIKRKYVNKKLHIKWNIGCTTSDIMKFEKSNSLILKEQIKDFYLFSNGLEVDDPALCILKLNDIRLDDNYLIFAIINKDIEIGFDLTSFKIGDQWDIICIKNGYIITHTFASFLFNKIQSWLDNKKHIWEEIIYNDYYI